MTIRNSAPRIALLASAAAILPSPALADTAPADSNAESSDPAIVVSATRTPVEVDEAPATVSVIDAEQIDDEFITDIRDLVRYEPGVTVRRAPARFGAALGTTGRARNEDIAIRGIGGNRVLIQVDGIRSPQGFSFGAQDAGRGGYADVSLVKSVEILRGPASALYGSDGLAGAVSFTTRDPVDLIAEGNTVGGFVSAQYNSADNEFVETAAIAGQSGSLSAMLAYTRRDFSELDNRGTVGGIGVSRTLPNPQDGQSDALLGKLVWQQGGHRLRLTGEYLQTEVFSDVLTGQGPAYLFGTTPSWIVDDLTALDTSERLRGSIDYTWEGEGVVDYAHLAAYYQDGEDVQFTDEDRSPVGTTPRPDRERLNTFENEVWGLVAEARSEFSTGNTGHVLAYGGDISWTRQEGLRDGVEPPFGEVFPTRAFPATDFMLGGVYLADQVSLLDGRLEIFPAVRFDFYELDPTLDPLLSGFTGEGQSGSRLSPKIGLTYDLTDHVLAFANYGQGFRAPTPSQVNNFFENLAYGYTSAPNADLGPERSESYEAGLRFLGDNVTASVTAFRADYSDFISQEVVGGSFTPSDPAIYQFVNLDSVRIEGIEARASLDLDNGLFGRVAAAYADGNLRDPAGDQPLSTIDPFSMVAGFGYRAPDGRFGGELIATYNAGKSLEDTAGLCTGDCYRPDSFVVLDVTAFYEVTPNLKLRAGIFNLANETYAYWSDVRGLSDSSTVTDAYTRPGRNASVSINFTF